MSSFSQCVYGWGSNQKLLFSKDKNKKILIPKKLKIQLSVSQIFCTSTDIIILSKQGKVYRFLNQYPNIFQGLQNIVKIAHGHEHFLALDSNGNVYSWGKSLSGCLGNQNFDYSDVPQPVLIKQKIIDIACGRYTSFFLTSSNEVYGCGSNKYGELGIRLLKNYMNPIKIQFGNVKIKQIASGIDHTLFLSVNGDIYAAGNGKNGKLGIKNAIDFNNKVEKIEINQKFKKIAASNYSAGITEKGYIYVWGTSVFGTFKQPTLYFKTKKMKSLILWKDNGYAITQEEQVWVWGKNEYGQLGLGDTLPRLKPTNLNILKNRCLQIFSGENITFCILAEEIKWHNKRTIDFSVDKYKNDIQQQPKTVRSKQKIRRTKVKLPEFQQYEDLKRGGFTSRENYPQAIESIQDDQTQKTQRNHNQNKKLFSQNEEISQLKLKMEELALDKEHLANIISQKQRLLQNVKIQVSNLEQMILKKNKSDNQKYQKTLKEEQEKLKQNYQKEIQQYKVKITNLTTQTIKTQKYMEELRRCKAKRQQQIEQLKKKEKKYQTQIQLFKISQKQLQNEVQKLNSKQKLNMIQIYKQKTQIEKQNQQIFGLIRQQKQKNHEIELINHKIISQRQINNEIKTQQQKYLKQIERIKQQWKGQIDQLKNQEKILKKQLEGNKKKFKSQIESKQEQVNSLNKKISELQNKILKYEKNNQKGIHQIQQFNKKISVIEREKQTNINNEIKSLQQTKIKLQNQIKQLKIKQSKNLQQIKKLAEANNKLILTNIEDQNDQISRFKNQISDLQLRINQLNNLLLDRDNKISDQIISFDSLNKQLSLSKQQLKQKVQEYQKRILQKNTEINEWKTKFDNKKQSQYQKQKKIQQLALNIVTVSNKNTLKQNLEIESLKKMNQQLSKNIKCSEQKNEILSKKMNQIINNYEQKINQQKKSCLAREDNLKNIIKQSEVKLESLNKAYNKINKEKQQNLKQNCQITQRYYSFIDNLKQKQSVIEEYHHELLKLKNFKKQAEIELAEYKKKQQTSQLLISDKQAKINELNQLISTYLNQHKNKQLNDFIKFRQKNQYLERIIIQCNGQLQHLRQNIFNKDQINQRLQYQISKFKVINQSITIGLNEKELLIKQLNEQILKIMSETKNQQNIEIINIKQKCSNLQKILQQKQDEIKSLNKQIEQQISQKNQLQQEQSNYKDRCYELAGTLKEKQIRIEEINHTLINQINRYAQLETELKQAKTKQMITVPKISEFNSNSNNQYSTHKYQYLNYDTIFNSPSIKQSQIIQIEHLQQKKQQGTIYRKLNTRNKIEGSLNKIEANRRKINFSAEKLINTLEQKS